MLLLQAKAVFASWICCSLVRDKDTGVTIHNFYYCTYFDIKRHLFKAQHAPVHPSVPLTQLKTQHKGANPLIRGSGFLFLLDWILWTFLLLLLTLQTEGKQSSRLSWLKYSPCKSIAQTGTRRTCLSCVSILVWTIRLKSWTVHWSEDESTMQSLLN